jgi:hypothetical protein
MANDLSQEPRDHAGLPFAPIGDGGSKSSIGNYGRWKALIGADLP